MFYFLAVCFSHFSRPLDTVVEDQSKPDHVREKHRQQICYIGKIHVADYGRILVQRITIRQITGLHHHIRNRRFTTWKTIRLILMNEDRNKTHQLDTRQHLQPIPNNCQVSCCHKTYNPAKIVPMPYLKFHEIIFLDSWA